MKIHNVVAILFAVFSVCTAYAQGDWTTNGQAELGATEIDSLLVAAKRGDVEAQYALGFIYSEGYRVPQDYAIALKWYSKAAEHGYAPAQSKLGEMYLEGLDVQQNYVEAVKWFRKAAEQGLFEGQLNLGFMYAVGRGVPKNDVEAYKWYNLAAANVSGEFRKSAAKSRDIIAETMTPEQIAEAQKLAQEWRANR